MANGFLRGLAKVGLVQLDEAETASASRAPDPADDPEIQRMVAEAEQAQAASAKKQKRTPSSPAPAAAAPRAAASAPRAAPPASTPAQEGSVAEGTPFESHYLAANVPETPYPAEKLLRLLDGLRAMDATTRKAAVLAMDAADDSWTIADVVLDAQRKSRALVQAGEALKSQVTAVVDQARQQKDARDQYLAAATAQIRKRIEELEQTLQKEITDIAAQKAQLDSQVEAAESAYRRESARLETEQRRLAEIPSTFIIDRSAR
jgi:hypothetical protein